MVDLGEEIAELWRSLGPTAPGRGRVVQFVAARRGEGTSTIARAFARHASQKARRRTWLIDLDLRNNGQCAAITAQSEALGPLGPAVSASPDDSSFLAVNPRQEGTPNAAYLAGHQVGNASWWVSRFRHELLRPRQAPHVMPGGDYWQAMRRHADLVVVDSRSLEESQAALSLAPHMDQTVLVVAAEVHDITARLRLRDSISAVGGQPAGLFYNRARKLSAPPLLRAIGL